MDEARPDRGIGIALWRQIADSLRADLAAGRVGTDRQLPTEAALSVRFGVNRHTVRRAIAALAEEGLVRPERGRGVFAEREPLDYPIGARTRFSEIVAAQDREPGGRLLGADEQPADTALAVELDVGVGTPLLRLQTLREADGLPIGLGTIWFELARVPGLAEEFEAAGSITTALAAAGIADYRRATTRILADVAGADDARLLAIEPSAPLLISESLDVTPDGRPLQFARVRFAAERVQLVVSS